jgi:integrase
MCHQTRSGGLQKTPCKAAYSGKRSVGRPGRPEAWSGEEGDWSDAHIKVQGKGRKRRATTLTPETVAVLHQWLKERHGQPEDSLFPTRQGQPLTRSGVRQLLIKHTATAAANCPSLNDKPVSPHTLRHYVDGWVMWPAGVFPVADVSLRP